MGSFDSIISNINSEHVYIQTHNFPDPDAIASAYGLAGLLEHYGISSSICYRGKIERYSTNGMVNSLGIEMMNIESESSLNPCDEIILVDSQKGNSNIIDTDGDEIICIDHHPTFENSKNVVYRFADIRPKYGACSTIIAEYYFENNIEMNTKVATALLYGIKTDTMGLSRGVNGADVEAYGKLFEMADQDILKSLEHCSINFEDLKAYGNAISSIKVFNNTSFANTGMDCPEALIATICDFMLDLIEVDFSVVYSIKQEGIKLSIRSAGKLDAGKITNQALKGIGGGGGHHSMAGGFVPVKDKNTDINLLVSEIQDRFIEVIDTITEDK